MLDPNAVPFSDRDPNFILLLRDLRSNIITKTRKRAGGNRRTANTGTTTTSKRTRKLEKFIASLPPNMRRKFGI